MASDDESYFKTAYILTEISYAANFVIVIVFWFILVPMAIEEYERTGVAKPTWEYAYNAVIHAIPFITTTTDLCITDMALERSHTWITFLVMCPCYMIANWYASIYVSGKGTIYGVEQWDKAPEKTIGYFIIGGFIQAGIFWISCPVFDTIWPMRPK